MTDSKRPRTEAELDAALKGTFPASDPVSPPSHVEEEKERRRRVLEQDAAKESPRTAEVRTDSPGRILLPMDTKKNSHTEDALDEALQETFPASDPVSVDAAVHEGEVRRRSARSMRKKPAARRKSPGKKKPTAKKRKSPPKARKKAARKKRARR